MGLYYKLKSDKHSSVLENAEKMEVSIDLDQPGIPERLKLIHLTEEDLKIIKSAQPLVQKYIDKIVKAFYDAILQVQELRDIIEKHSTVQRLQKTLRVHLIEMFQGNINKNFVEKRLQIASTHYRIGLEHGWYIGSFQNIQNALNDILFQEIGRKEEVRIISAAISKILSFEQQIVLEAYENETIRRLNEQYQNGQHDLKEQMVQISEGLVTLAEETQASVESLGFNLQKTDEMAVESSREASYAESSAAEGQKKLGILIRDVKMIATRTKEMMETIENLSDSSRQIEDVVLSVKEIADQTNLLALNSAIEAARAGEYGRGFSIVSQEIRKLSEETKKLAGQIQSMLSASGQYNLDVKNSLIQVDSAIHSGLGSAEEAGQSFQQITATVKQSKQTALTVQGHIAELVNTVKEIETASAGVAAAAEKLHNAAGI